MYAPSKTGSRYSISYEKQLPLLLILLLLPVLPVSFDTEAPTERIQGIVVDRAMDDGLPYLGISCEDGSGVCVYFQKEHLLSEDVAIGTQVEILCRVVPQEHGKRYYAIELSVFT